MKKENIKRGSTVIYRGYACPVQKVGIIFITITSPDGLQIKVLPSKVSDGTFKG